MVNRKWKKINKLALFEKLWRSKVPFLEKVMKGLKKTQVKKKKLIESILSKSVVEEK